MTRQSYELPSRNSSIFRISFSLEQTTSRTHLPVLISMGPAPVAKMPLAMPTAFCRDAQSDSRLGMAS